MSLVQVAYDRAVNITMCSLHLKLTILQNSRPSLRSTQPPIQWVLGALSLGVNRQGREADHSPPTSAEVNKS
jgi:hypothetical protein